MFAVITDITLVQKLKNNEARQNVLVLIKKNRVNKLWSIYNIDCRHKQPFYKAPIKSKLKLVSLISDINISCGTVRMALELSF